jgi:hypothetical protein
VHLGFSEGLTGAAGEQSFVMGMEAQLSLHSRFPCSVGRTVWTRQNHGVTIGVSKPQFPVIWSAVAIRWISMARQHHFGLEFACSECGGLKIIDFKPKKDSVASAWIIDITNPSVMVILLPPVQLQHQSSVDFKSLIVWATMRTVAVQKPLVPPTTGFDIICANQRLRPHNESPVLPNVRGKPHAAVVCAGRVAQH